MVTLRDGYVVDLVYAPNWRSELSPGAIRSMMLMNGWAPPVERPSYLELGFGRGRSLNVIAAANDGRFEGIDFIPEHADEVSAIAALSQAPLSVAAEGFADYAARGGGEDFDIIALHGVWSWVDDAARAAIARIAAERLRPGGIVLISYNTPAGWAPLEPLRQLFLLSAAAGGERSDAAMSLALKLAGQISDVGGGYFDATPSARAQLDKLRGRDPHYLVHEYLNEGHRLFSFAETRRALSAAGLEFAGPARYAEFIDRRRLTAPKQAILADLSDVDLEEHVRDLMQTTRFRSDLFVKNGVRLGNDPAMLLDQRFAPIAEPPAEIAARESPNFQAYARRVMAKLLEEGGAPKTLRSLLLASGAERSDVAMLAVMALCGEHLAAPLAAAGATEIASRHNAAAALRPELPLASPLTGGEVPASPLDRLFFTAHAEGEQDLADAVAARLKRDGKRLMGDDEAADLRRHADRFLNETLPRLRRLGVAAPD